MVSIRAGVWIFFVDLIVDLLKCHLIPREDFGPPRWGEVGSVKEEKELPFNMWNGTEKPLRLRFTRSI